MSGEKFQYTISIDYKKNKELVMHQLKGCGKYNTDYRLNDLWVLEKLNGKEMEKSFFKDNLPSLEINSETNSFSGFAGCNGMSGQLFYEKELLRFTKIITTMMYCGDTNKEREFLKALNSATKYTIENNRLTLSNPSKELMVFKKID
jgi:heat shock protein HslJ